MSNECKGISSGPHDLCRHFFFSSYFLDMLHPTPLAYISTLLHLPTLALEHCCGLHRLWNLRAEWSHCSSLLWTTGWGEGADRHHWHTQTLSFSLFGFSSLSLSDPLSAGLDMNDEGFCETKEKGLVCVSDSSVPLTVPPVGLWVLNMFHLTTRSTDCC